MLMLKNTFHTNDLSLLVSECNVSVPWSHVRGAVVSGSWSASV